MSPEWVQTFEQGTRQEPSKAKRTQLQKAQRTSRTPTSCSTKRFTSVLLFHERQMFICSKTMGINVLPSSVEPESVDLLSSANSELGSLASAGYTVLHNWMNLKRRDGSVSSGWSRGPVAQVPPQSLALNESISLGCWRAGTRHCPISQRESSLGCIIFVFGGYRDQLMRINKFSSNAVAPFATVMTFRVWKSPVGFCSSSFILNCVPGWATNLKSN